MTLRVPCITLLAILVQTLLLGGSEATSLSVANFSAQQEPGQGRFLVAHLQDNDGDEDDSNDENDRDEEDRDDEKRHKKYKKCHYKKHFHFCGPRSLRLKTIDDLKFGRVIADSQQGGSVVIHADTGSKTVNQLYDAGGFHSRAQFEIKGKPYKKFVIALPDKITLPANTGIRSRVGRFTVFPSTIGRFGRDGKARVFIGGTLKLGPTKQGGEGSGPVPIYVDYVR
ncbi:MAG: hypothetical protein NPINA01_08090 [Nitrospinaceae bacterium]|nr:MAG: hypothetical protein NPINA01_08090 [Nitrospinaceae bacterium]